MSIAVEPKSRISVAEPVGARSLVPRVPFSWIGPTVVFVDLFVTISASIACGYLYHRLVFGTDGDVQTFFAVGVAVFAYFAAISGYRGNYAVDQLSLARRQAREVTLIWLLVFLLLVSVAFLLKIGPTFSRGATLTFFVAGWLALTGWHWCVARHIARARATGAFAERRIIILADPRQLASATHVEDLRRCGYRAAKILMLPETGSAHGVVEEVVSTTRERSGIEGIFVVVGWDQIGRINELVAALRVVPLPVRLLPDPKLAHLLDRPAVHVGTLRTAELQRQPLTIEERAAKRLMDIVLAGVAGVALLPLMLIVALLIRLDSPGPVFFTQTRNGFNSRAFRIFKFRTLKTLEDGPVIKQVTRNDGRLTRLGRLLRRTSIDELPQLLNVLRGDMSLVGPRPHAAAHNSEYERLIGNYAFRHHVKPGLTGWAQVNGLRGETATIDVMKRRVELDLWYVNNWSLWLDIAIIARTVLLVLRQRSAY